MYSVYSTLLVSGRVRWWRMSVYHLGRLDPGGRPDVPRHADTVPVLILVDEVLPRGHDP